MPAQRCTGALKFSNVKRRTSNVKLAALFCLVVLFLTSCSNSRVPESPHNRVVTEPAQPVRIVSLAPSITEILFEIDLEDRVVGVTRYCDYPQGALEKPRVGGYYDVNYEALLALEPDLVIHLVEHEDAGKRLEDLGIETVTVDHSRVKGILDSITVIADRCRVSDKGTELRRSLENRMNNVSDMFLSGEIDPRYADLSRRSHNSLKPKADTPTPRYTHTDRPRILVAVGRSLQSGDAGEIYVSGRDGYYDDLINLAGGVNAYQDETLKFPALSAEGLAQLDPDVIIEMIPDLLPGREHGRLVSYWNDIPGLKAVRKNRVYILTGDHVVVPGPRFIDLLEEMGGIINQVEN